MITADASLVFTSTDDFAEVVTYKRLNNPSWRTINAVVFRESYASSEESGGVTTPLFEVHVANSETLGISSDEINLGGDVLTFSVRDGLPACDRTITAIITQDHGMLVLQCQ